MNAMYVLVRGGVFAGNMSKKQRESCPYPELTLHRCRPLIQNRIKRAGNSVNKGETGDSRRYIKHIGERSKA